MEYFVGSAIAIFVGVLGLLAGFDREKSFYSTVLIVVASYYALFAVMGANDETLVKETVLAGVFLVLAVAGFRRSHWLVVAGLVGHGVFDFFHHMIVENPGVPPYWPGFCGAFDVVAGAWLAARMVFSQPSLQAVRRAG